MQWKIPKNTDKYFWTAHVTEKMHFYGLSEQKVLGVIRRPERIEKSIVDNVVAVMVPVGNITIGTAKPKWGKPVFGNAHIQEDVDEEKKKKEASWNQEIWVMYQTKSQSRKLKAESQIENPKLRELEKRINLNKQITIISAWRYPGVSPKNNPIPEDIMREIEELSLT
jgi:hypothetical protein